VTDTLFKYLLNLFSDEDKKAMVLFQKGHTIYKVILIKKNIIYNIQCDELASVA
jgi:hypothetical protein